MRISPTEHDDDETVGDEGDEDEDGEDHSVNWLHQLYWSEPGGNIDWVASLAAAVKFNIVVIFFLVY